MDIYRAAKRSGKDQSLDSDAEVSGCFSVYFYGDVIYHKGRFLANLFLKRL